jgi:hypothetical protein
MEGWSLCYIPLIRKTVAFIWHDVRIAKMIIIIIENLYTLSYNKQCDKT